MDIQMVGYFKWVAFELLRMVRGYAHVLPTSMVFLEIWCLSKWSELANMSY